MKRIILVLIMLYATAYGVQLEIEVLVPNSMTSDHYGNCKPTCANQENGGIGGQIGISGDVNISVLYIEFINSYGDPGSVLAIEPLKMDHQCAFFRGEASILLMEVRGYKHEDGSPKVQRIPWPKFEIGINPFFMLNENIFINYNYLNFIAVKVGYFTIGYYHGIKKDSLNVAFAVERNQKARLSLIKTF